MSMQLLHKLIMTMCSVGSAQVQGKVEYMYYSVSSKSHSFNPLYRMDIASRAAKGVCVCV